jgi:DNA processing protein
METRNFDLLMLALLPGVPPRARQALLSLPDLGAALDRPDELGDLLPEAALEEVRSGRLRRRAEAELDATRKAGVALVALGAPDYPELLAQICDPPPVLWVRGSLSATDAARGVAIVGSRQATGAGRTLARGMARDLAASGVTIVSGLALGIDGEAHRGALEARGRTVAVLGSGLEQIYPGSHADLAERVALSGAVVSEFALATPPYKGNFPRRNRVIAGWTRAVVVVEAAARSGALVTARVAVDEGREVMAVPGHPTSPTAGGTNALIRDGAALVRDAADVARELEIELRRAAPDVEPLLKLLRGDAALSVDDLVARSGLAVPALLQRLGELELERKVQRLPGALYMRGV